ncbi:phosphate-starvation-inducible PsiE family protein [Streptomyces sp. NPDC059389]|uniref:phosphate-starvation-inducible PsiE family protein n=1 Tax=Streptomyces sp. NPDC059389 TaxID=3346818 RepID=UPI0036B548BA
MHLVAAALLVLLAGLLTVGVVRDVVKSIQGPYREETIVLSALDSSLVLFIVAELLHTVRLTIRNQTLDAEPFLVVGLIAGVRKVLIVTAEAEKSFRWQVKGCRKPIRVRHPLHSGAQVSDLVLVCSPGSPL